jgi:Xaa-Pro aminopeptidase
MLPQLVNLPRARALMERTGADALVAQLPINVYYPTGDWGFLASTERFDAANFAVLPVLRRGTRYSELERVAIETVRRNGFQEFRYVTPHGLGLEHTNDPKPVGAQPGTKPDQVLEPGMVINVDMPYTEIGWGSLHLEDKVRITSDGHELLTTAALDLRCVPG